MPSLLLHPQDAGWYPRDTGAFAAFLHDLGLAGRRWPGDSNDRRYAAGDEFLKLVMFLGCSPHVVLDPESPEASQSACAVRLMMLEAPALLAPEPLPATRCSECRASVSVPDTPKPESYYSCKHCGKKLSLTSLDWRQAAGYARFFLEFGGIHPHEAVPSDRLLLELEAVSSCSWSYFFADLQSCRTR